MTDELEKYRLKMRCLELAVGEPDPLKVADSYYDWVMGGAVTTPLRAVWVGDVVGLRPGETVADLHASVPADPATAPTVAPYDGCWVVLRGGRVVGPLIRDVERDWRCGEYSWWLHGAVFGFGGPHSDDIIAVHPSDPRIVAEEKFTPWFGGKRPVDGQVAVRLRDGRTGGGEAKYYSWQQDGADNDIVGYRRLS